VGGGLGVWRDGGEGVAGRRGGGGVFWLESDRAGRKGEAARVGAEGGANRPGRLLPGSKSTETTLNSYRAR